MVEKFLVKYAEAKAWLYKLEQTHPRKARLALAVAGFILGAVLV